MLIRILILENFVYFLLKSNVKSYVLYIFIIILKKFKFKMVDKIRSPTKRLNKSNKPLGTSFLNIFVKRPLIFKLIGHLATPDLLKCSFT